MKKRLKWLLIFALFVISFFSASLDLFIARLFYKEAAEGAGSFFQSSFTDYMFRYGDKIGMSLGFIAGIIYLLSLFFPQWKKWRPAALLMILSLVLGAGLLINGVFKEYWGRPRPKQVVEFGGKHEFRPFYRPNFYTRHDPEKSFPSGHTAMGFYFLTLCYVGKRYRKTWIYLSGCLLTLMMGLGLMITRIVQGGHFFTDTIYSAFFMWATIYLLDRLIFEKMYSTFSVSETKSL